MACFGRFPEELIVPGTEQEWRFSSEVREDFEAPIPGGYILSPPECDYASMPPDPIGLVRYENAKLHKHQSSDLLRPDDYSTILLYIESKFGRNSARYKAWANVAKFSQWAHHDFAEWQEMFEHHVDQFANEIMLQLRKGNIKARGTKLPFVDRKKTWNHLLETDTDLNDLEVVEIPDVHWVRDSVNWPESYLANSKHAYCWVHLNTADVLATFPPRKILRTAEVGVLPGNLLIVTDPSLPPAEESVKRGRKPFPWKPFHVEVARLFRDNKMDPKMESAIAHFMGWFLREHGERVARSTLSQALKPYYDALVRKKVRKLSM